MVAARKAFVSLVSTCFCVIECSNLLLSFKYPSMAIYQFNRVFFLCYFDLNIMSWGLLNKNYLCMMDREWKEKKKFLWSKILCIYWQNCITAGSILYMSKTFIGSPRELVKSKKFVNVCISRQTFHPCWIQFVDHNTLPINYSSWTAAIRNTLFQMWYI